MSMELSYANDVVYVIDTPSAAADPETLVSFLRKLDKDYPRDNPTVQSAREEVVANLKEARRRVRMFKAMQPAKDGKPKRTADQAFTDQEAIFGKKLANRGGISAEWPSTEPEFDDARYQRILPILRDAAGAFPDLHGDPLKLVTAMVVRMRGSFPREAMEGIRPYMKRWYDDLMKGVETLEEQDDAPSPDDGLEPGGDGAPSDGNGEATVPPDDGGNGNRTGA